MSGDDTIVGVLVDGALRTQPARVTELCGLLAGAGLVGHRYWPPDAVLPWPDVSFAVGPKGRCVTVTGGQEMILRCWEEYPEVRKARVEAMLRHPWP